LSVTIFEKVPIYQLVKNESYKNIKLEDPNQLTLFDY